MVSALEADDVLLARGLSSDFDGGLHGLGPRVPEEELVERWVGHRWQELLNELEVWLVESDRALQVDELVDLSGGGGTDMWVAAGCRGVSERPFATRICALDSLSEVGHSNTRGKVQ